MRKGNGEEMPHVLVLNSIEDGGMGADLGRVLRVGAVWLCVRKWEP